VARLEWLPFGFAVVMAATWFVLAHGLGCQLHTSVVTALLFGLGMEAWFLIPPHGMGSDDQTP